MTLYTVTASSPADTTTIICDSKETALMTAKCFMVPFDPDDPFAWEDKTPTLWGNIGKEPEEYEVYKWAESEDQPLPKSVLVERLHIHDNPRAAASLLRNHLR